MRNIMMAAILSWMAKPAFAFTQQLPQKKESLNAEEIMRNKGGKLEVSEVKVSLKNDYNEIDLDIGGCFSNLETKNALKPENGHLPKR
ncbi:hypothetical protein V6R21_01500 [Limibacter armeniacum]|uniref:hypothetical protein n=1 Tax=Limibacter armeniacum TaxID=466084 RepID=UPI002FE664F5